MSTQPARAPRRYTQVKNLRTAEAFRSYVDAAAISLPFADCVDPDGPLSTPLSLLDAAGQHTVANRFAALPMEGWDGTADGRPSDLTRRRWLRIGAGGFGLVWGEASAVCPDGRANPNQLVLAREHVADFAELRALVPASVMAGLQLTHSGRWSRPDGRARPQCAQAHPLLDGRVDRDRTTVLGDDDLDRLVELFVAAAGYAADAGFDFVDVKHCHGYLLHELLGARTRRGRYGGDLDARLRFLRSVVAGIRARSPQLAIAVRLSVFDFVPFRTGSDGVGVAEHDPLAPRPFGGDDTGTGVDLSETHLLLQALEDLGVGLVSTTAGSPYYNPHIQRPAYFPPSDGYLPPEDPLAGVARQIHATAELAREHPGIAFIGSAYSYLQEWCASVGQAVVANGGAAMIGLGRMALSYPDFPADILAGKVLVRQHICRTFSDCTTAPRAGLVSGCFPLDEFYKQHPDRAVLAAAKRRLRSV